MIALENRCGLHQAGVKVEFYARGGAGGNFEQFNILYKTDGKANFYENRGLVESLNKSFLKSRAKYLIFHRKNASTLPFLLLQKSLSLLIIRIRRLE